MKFGQKLANLANDMRQEHYGAPTLPEDPNDIPSPEDIFQGMQFDSFWAEAEVVQVVRYLRGGTGLAIPDAFRPVLPRVL